MQITYKNKKYVCDYKIWKCIQDFIKSYLSKTDFILDVGCGNGKNIKYLKENNFTNVHGCDIDDDFIKECAEQHLNVTKCNILNLPYANNQFDVVLCNGVIHHLQTSEQRKCAIQEILRISKSKSKIFLSVNSFESKYYSKITNVQDIWINYQDKKIFYHLYKEDELKTFLASFDCTIIKTVNECSSLRIIIEKN
jgi:ubiquinone/menaquinone biosynthesis C-methylase UbiE